MAPNVEVMLIWFLSSIFLLKIIARWTQRHRIANERHRLRSLAKWLNGTFGPGEQPCESDRLFLRSGLNIYAENGKIKGRGVIYTPVREFFPATSNFLHSAYDEYPFLIIIIPVLVFVGMAFVF